MRLSAFLFGSACLTALAIPAAAQEPQETAADIPVVEELSEEDQIVRNIYMLKFEAADVNNDKIVDRTEYETSHNDFFMLSDADGSGGLSIKEIDGLTPIHFRTVDSDRDGAISLEEYMNARSVDFAIADRSRDGKLSFDEVKNWAIKE